MTWKAVFFRGSYQNSSITKELQIQFLVEFSLFKTNQQKTKQNHPKERPPPQHVKRFRKEFHDTVEEPQFKPKMYIG